ncbi:F-box protein [Sporobolomyces koalae]|uniref:F-box protein n=1 Tax=Sporobolomyces koalae TaxID=500713 RepID=UPI003173A2BD
MATRASARIKDRGQVMLALDDSSDCGAKEDSDDETFEAPNKKPKAGKRQKNGRSSSKKKANKLEAFASMPLDILCLIMEQMNPKTLLAMSRTCSIFRSILHSPRGQTVWKCAREQIGLNALQRPDVPEWEFASLLFESGCVVCGSARASHVNYIHFARACGKCMKDNSKQRKNIKKSLLHPRVFEMIPYASWMEWSFWWKPRLERATIQLDELEADLEALERLIASREDIQNQAQADERMIERWHSRCRAEEEEAEKARKLVRIVTKLRDLGYEEQDLQSPDLAHHPDVCNSRILTDNVWKRIRPNLKRLLESKRSDRLEKEALERKEQRKLALKPYYDDWVLDMPEWYCHPPFEKFLILPSVASLHELDDEGPTAERLSSSKSIVFEDIEQHAIQFEDKLLHDLLFASKTVDPVLEAQNQLSLMHCTSAMDCPRYWHCEVFSTFLAKHDHYSRCAGARTSIKEQSPVQIQAIRQIIAAVNASSLSVQPVSDASSMADLFALGDRFDCVTCGDAESQSKWYWQGLATTHEYATKAQSWVSMVAHIKRVHRATPPEVRYNPPACTELEHQTLEPAEREGAVE